MSHEKISHTTRMNAPWHTKSCHTYECVMSHVWHDSLTYSCVAWLTDLSMCHSNDSLVCMAWHIGVFICHLYDSLVRVAWLIDLSIRHSYDSLVCVT